MMKQKAIILLTLAALAVPFAASALTIGDLQAQLGALQQKLQALVAPQAATNANENSAISLPRICASIPARSLSVGVRGDDVVSLQEFLRGEGVFSANATGYFGPITAQSLARWQASQGISAIGVAGPLTRARIRARCGIPVACTLEYAPVCGSKPIVCITTPCNPVQQTYGNRCQMNADGATFLYEGECREQSGNRPPVVSGFSGPTTLTLNEVGTWSIQASDPENGPLTYSIVWGDEWYAGASAMQTSAEASIVQTTTFTHSYTRGGTYTVAVTVRDNTGQEARATATITVSGNLVYCTMEYAPVCGQPPEPACRHSIPACMMATPGPQTYSNRCMMNTAGATFLHEGTCAAY